VSSLHASQTLCTIYIYIHRLETCKIRDAPCIFFENSGRVIAILYNCVNISTIVHVGHWNNILGSCRRRTIGMLAGNRPITGRVKWAEHEREYADARQQKICGSGLVVLNLWVWTGLQTRWSSGTTLQRDTATNKCDQNNTVHWILIPFPHYFVIVLHGRVLHRREEKRRAPTRRMQGKSLY
jgi:hypothetical protein